MWKLLGLLIVLANLLGFALVAVDKWRAKTERWRTSEFALVIPAALGGWPGILLAMKWFRHKTRKRSFQLKLFLGAVLSFAWMGLYLWHRH